MQIHELLVSQLRYGHLIENCHDNRHRSNKIWNLRAPDQADDKAAQKIDSRLPFH